MRVNTLEELKSYIQGDIFETIATSAKKLNYPAYVVGGYVRDSLLGKECKDIDIVCVGSGIELATQTAMLLDPDLSVNVFKHFGTAHFRFLDIDVEFVGARKESYSKESRNPIVENGTLEDDQLRRDLTINALAVSLNEKDYGTLMDPFNGMSDLKNGIIKTPADPDVTFSDDPLRMMRAIRFASQLDFTISDSTYEGIKNNKDRIKIVSIERITDELNKIILSDKPSVGFKHLHNTGLLEIIFPEFYALRGVEVKKGIGHKDNFYHTLIVLDNVAVKSSDLWLRWAAILHDIAKPNTKRFSETEGWTFHGHEPLGARMVPKIFRKMRLPLDAQMRKVQKLVELHLRPVALAKKEVTDSGIRRLLFDAGEYLEDLLILCRADITSKNEEKVKRFLKNFDKVEERLKEVEAKDKIRNWQPPITGEIIMEIFQIKPCKEVGIIKTTIKDAILDDKIKNSYDAAFQLMLETGKKLGLTPVKKAI